MNRLVNTFLVLDQRMACLRSLAVDQSQNKIAFPVIRHIEGDLEPLRIKHKSYLNPYLGFQARAHSSLPHQSHPFLMNNSRRLFSEISSQNGTAHSKYSQKRNFSASPHSKNPSITSLVTEAVSHVPDPYKPVAWVGIVIAASVAILGIGHIVKSSPSSDLRITLREDDPEKIRELIAFVEEFNREKARIGNTEGMIEPQNKAFDHIKYLRQVGGLSSWRGTNIDPHLAKRGFLALAECHDPMIHRESLRYLNTLLKSRFDPTQPLKELLWLEGDIGEMLKNKNGVNDSVPMMQELVTAYGLILEKIFLFCLYSGSEISNDDKLEVVKRAKAVSRKLKENPAFQYQALNAEMIAKHIQAPPEKFVETFKGFSELVQIGQDCGVAITPLLVEELFSYEGWEKLEDFILNKSPEIYEKTKDTFSRLQNSWLDLRDEIPFYESMFLLRPCYLGLETNEDALRSVSKSIELLGSRPCSDWVSSCRLVDILSDTALSNSKSDLREEAFKQIIAMTKPEMPWQARSKVAMALLSLKSDPLFSIRATEKVDSPEAQQVLFRDISPEMRRGLSWFKIVKAKMEEIDKAISSRSSIKPEGLENLFESWTFREQVVIQRKDVHAKILSNFQQPPPETVVQGIYGQGGLGKTTLAITYLQRYGGDYSSVDWIDARTFAQDLERLAVKNGVFPDPDPIKRQEKLKEKLEEKTGQLIVIDNVENFNRETFLRFYPRKGAHILITARSLDAHWNNVLSENLHVLENQEEIYLLTHNTSLDTSIDYQGAGTVARMLFHLPLALVQARFYIKNNSGMTFGDFSRIYNEERTNIFASAPIGTAENESVHTTWNMSFKQVQERNRSAAELISCLSFVSPHEIPRSLIEKWKEKYAPEMSLAQCFEAIRILLEYVLLESKGTGIYQLHPLIQEVSRLGLSDQDRLKYLQQAITVVTDLDGFKKFNPVREGTHDGFEKIRPHSEAIFEIVQKRGYQDLDSNFLEELQYLINTIGRYQLYIGKDFKLAQQCFVEIDTISDLLGQKSGLYKGWSYYLQALLKQKQRKPLEAISLFKWAKEEFNKLDESIFDNHRLESNMPKWNKTYALAICKLETLNAELEKIINQDVSIETLEKFYQKFENLKKSFEQGPERDFILKFDIPRIMRGQARILRKQKNYPDAQELLENALTMQREMYDKTPDTSFMTSPTPVPTLEELARVCYDRKDYAGAVKNQKEAYDINMNIYKNKEHTYVQRVMETLRKYEDALTDSENEH